MLWLGNLCAVEVNKCFSWTKLKYNLSLFRWNVNDSFKDEMQKPIVKVSNGYGMKIVSVV